tara:strand:+ start:195 stop:1622 length:1428 start_codon:yes stop_codon:yes gene_type:complete
MQHFYDGQIRRFVTQFVRVMSNFSYKDSAGTLRKIPTSYGNLTRQVAHILRDNSENKVVSAPRVSCYITGLEYARDRVQNPTHVSKVHLRERDYNPATGEYLDTQGPGYTVERVMPVPFSLQMKCDIWSTNTDQKLQIMEQMLVLFNPSLEIQSTANYVDWTSLSLIELQNVNFSTRSIPQGTETEIDIGELTFTMPIWITPPARVKQLGVIEKIVMSVFDETGSISDGIIDAADPMATVNITPGNFGVLILNNTAKLLAPAEGVSEPTPGNFDRTGEAVSWFKLLDQYPGKFRAGLSTVRLSKADGNEIVATASVNPTDDTQIVLNFDSDTVPGNTILADSIASRGTIDAIIDPLTFNPDIDNLAQGTRYLILNDIHEHLKNDSSDANMNAWQNADGTVVQASTNDIITWNGSNWEITFDAGSNDGRADSSVAQAPVYITNTYTGVQYKFTNDAGAWLKSYEGEYLKGSWRLVL